MGDKMEIPNYVLKANESVWQCVNYNPALGFVKKLMIAIVVVAAVGSILFGENLFLEISPSAWLMFIISALYVFKGQKMEKVASPFEIRFYDEYLVLYREKHYYSPKLYRKEYDKFLYKDIKSCEFRTVTRRINIYGVVEGIWYDYKKDGTIPEIPTYHKTTDSICYFYTDFADSIDFVKEIETHSPIKVIIENN